MSTTHVDNDTPAMFSSISQQLDSISMLLRAQYEQAKRNAPLRFVANCAVNQFAVSRDTQGVIRMIHNTTGNALTVTLNESGSSGGPAFFSGQLAAFESRLMYLPFRSGVFCVAGAGAVLGGDIDRA